MPMTTRLKAPVRGLVATKTLLDALGVAMESMSTSPLGLVLPPHDQTHNGFRLTGTFYQLVILEVVSEMGEGIPYLDVFPPWE